MFCYFRVSGCKSIKCSLFCFFTFNEVQWYQKFYNLFILFLGKLKYWRRLWHFKEETLVILNIFQKITKTMDKSVDLASLEIVLSLTLYNQNFTISVKCRVLLNIGIIFYFNSVKLFLLWYEVNKTWWLRLLYVNLQIFKYLFIY